MTIEAQSADGVIHEFPDGTPDAAIDRAMRDYAQSQRQPTPPSSASAQVSAAPGGLYGLARDMGVPGFGGEQDYAERQARNAPGRAASLYQGATLGFGDEAAGALAGAGAYVLSGLDSEAAGSAYAGARDSVRGAATRYAAENPVSSFALTALGGGVAGYAMTPKALLTQTGTVPMRLAKAGGTGAAFGGVAGFGESEGGLENRLTGAGIGAAAGGAGGVLVDRLGPGASKVIDYVQKWFGRAPVVIDEATGAVTAEGRRILQAGGIPDEDITPALATELRDAMKGQAIDATRAPEGAAIVALARSLDVPVPLSKGNVQLDATQQGFEAGAARGAYGAAAEGVMRPFQEGQDEALRANIPYLQARLARGGPMVERGVGGELASNRLSEMERSAWDDVNRTFDAARAGADGRIQPEAPQGLPGLPGGPRMVSGPQAADEAGAAAGASADDALNAPARAGLDRAQTNNLIVSMREGLSSYSPLAAKNTYGIIEQFNRTFDASRGEGLTLIRSIFELRERLENAAMEGTPDWAASRAAISGIDRYLREAVENDLITGDPRAIEFWNQAIQKRAQYGAVFEGKDLIEKLVARDRIGGRAQLKVSGEDAANIIFGAGNLTFINKPGLARDVARLRDVLGEDSPEWNGIRQELFLRLAANSQGGAGPLERGFSGAKLQKAWKDFNDNAKPLLRTMFSDDERRAIGNWVAVAARVKNPVPGAVNTSGTAYAMARMVGALEGAAGKIPGMGAALKVVLMALKDARNTIKAERSIDRPLVQPLRTLPTGGLIPGTGAAAGSMSGVQSERQP